MIHYTQKIKVEGDASSDDAERARAISDLRKWNAESCASSIDFVNALVRSGTVTGRETVGRERQAKIDVCTKEAEARLQAALTSRQQSNDLGLAESALQEMGAKQPFEGMWAQTKGECLDEDGPNSRTLIDLNNLIKGQTVPLFDQYENHCRIEKRTTVGSDTTLTATCFESGERFEKRINGTKATIKLSSGPAGRLVINGKTYQRCEPKSP